MSSAGELIRRVRKAQKKTLVQVASAAGISGPFLSQIESGVRNTSEETYKKIASELDIPERELLLAAGYIDEKEKQALSYGAEIQMFEKALFQMQGVLKETLQSMKELGEFKDFNDDYNNIPIGIIDLIHTRTNELKFLYSSKYKNYYNEFMIGLMNASELSNYILVLNRHDENPYNQLSIEAAGIRRDVEPFVTIKGESISFSPIPFKKDISLAEAFGFTSPNPNRFHERHPNGLTSSKVYRVPINNIHFHLTDPLNQKLYKDLVLTLEDRENIISIIDAYLLHRYINESDDKERSDFVASLTEKPVVISEWENNVPEEGKPNGQH